MKEIFFVFKGLTKRSEPHFDIARGYRLKDKGIGVRSQPSILFSSAKRRDRLWGLSILQFSQHDSPSLKLPLPSTKCRCKNGYGCVSTAQLPSWRRQRQLDWFSYIVRRTRAARLPSLCTSEAVGCHTHVTCRKQAVSPKTMINEHLIHGCRISFTVLWTENTAPQLN
jgi:hypothetical protein